MSYRKVPLVNDGIYHVFSKSIAGFNIFNCIRDYGRMMNEMLFYNTESPPFKFSLYEELNKKHELLMSGLLDPSKRLVAILAYCLMPTHIHFILKQLTENGIYNFQRLILMSYTKYFNKKYKRKGPLWEGRFKNVLVKDDDQFLHLTRYIHLNPTTASLVDDPKDWEFSSYKEYLDLATKRDKLCEFSGYFNMDPVLYEKFVNDRKDYQKKLASIKHLTLE
ncbi:MAG: hypothetical protein DRP85_06795 [Candidatus Makaraimicrobium thalassicum]|nr:MAG: hypothetical protein DRP85_06795 [Candidatus Omnitrophota bacterium]